MSNLESTAHALAGVAAGVSSMALFWPLEKIRLEVQSQTQSKLREPGDKFAVDAHPKEEVTVVSCVKHIWRTKGVTGFYQGIESALYGTCASQLVFFYLYSFLKSAHARRGGALGPLENTAIASVSGAINALLTSPIWLVNTRIAVQKADVPAADRLNGLCDGMVKIARREGVAALWDGIAPALVLVSNPVIQFVCYEQFCKMLLERRSAVAGKLVKALTGTEYFVLGAAAKAIATILTYPLLSVKTRIQTGQGHKFEGITDCVIKIFQHEGIAGFFKGLPAKFTQTVLSAAFMFLTYETFVAMMMRFVKRVAGQTGPALIAAATQ